MGAGRQLSKIINGIDGKLILKDQATKAQTAAVLMRLMEPDQ